MGRQRLSGRVEAMGVAGIVEDPIWFVNDQHRPIEGEVTAALGETHGGPVVVDQGLGFVAAVAVAADVGIWTLPERRRQRRAAIARLPHVVLGQKLGAIRSVRAVVAPFEYVVIVVMNPTIVKS